MTGTKVKQFRDSVHGYIAVPESFCELFIDTPIFQRLKHIEQTSIRPLYPSARHDRFVHSLGVFHLASLAFTKIQQNTDPKILEGLPLVDYAIAFRVAALMHDCAHSPFSHALEAYYNRQDRAKSFVFKHVDDEFKNDYSSLCKYRGSPKAHEIFSAAVFLKYFQAQFAQLCSTICPTLVARMITGCTHWEPKDNAEQFENCLISLINGAGIDVDKLDYILRDTWASGVNNISIDLQRLLGALEVVRGQSGLAVAFRKSALSVIKSVLDGRNFLYRWVYSHHTVVYYNYVLNGALLSLDRSLSGGGEGTLIDAIFSEEAYEKPVCVGDCCLYLPCDDDIFSLLKMHAGDMPYVKELMSRKPDLVPLWKTQAEFELIFKDKDGSRRAYVQDRVGEKLAAVLGVPSDSQHILVLPVTPSVVPIEESDLYVSILNGVVSFAQLADTCWEEVGRERKNVSFFYVYIPREFKNRITDCIEALKAPV